jgi:hypothetical protein
VEAVAVGQVEAVAAYRGVATVLGRAGVSSPGLLAHSFFFRYLQLPGLLGLIFTF